MKIYVKIEYRDDTEAVFECVDNPAVSDWITLYLPELKRIMIPKEAIKGITITVK